MELTNKDPMELEAERKRDKRKEGAEEPKKFMVQQGRARRIFLFEEVLLVSEEQELKVQQSMKRFST